MLSILIHFFRHDQHRDLWRRRRLLLVSIIPPRKKLLIIWTEIRHVVWTFSIKSNVILPPSSFFFFLSVSVALPSHLSFLWRRFLKKEFKLMGWRWWRDDAPWYMILWAITYNTQQKTRATTKKISLDILFFCDVMCSLTRYRSSW